MKIAVLSRKKRLYSTRRLVDAGRARGLDMAVMDPLDFDIRLGREVPELFYKRRPVQGIDAVIPRIGQSITVYGLAVVRQFESLGIYTLNESAAIARSRDKLRAQQILAGRRIPTPETVFSRHPEHVGHAVDLIGGTPVIVKLIQGTQGVGVMRADTRAAAESLIDTLHGLNQNILIQRYIRESEGRDIRAFVVNGRVVAAMRRVAEREEEFRSNIHRGGKGEAFRLPTEYRRTAVEAAEAIGLRVAGVDMLISDHGPLVLEVNSSPGLEGIEAATGIDVADKIINCTVRRARSKDADPPES